MIDAEQRRRIAAAYAEHVGRQHAHPGTLTRDEARALGPTDGRAPAPTRSTDDEVTAACERLFATHKGD